MEKKEILNIEQVEERQEAAVEVSVKADQINICQ